MDERLKGIYRYILKYGRPIKVIPMINNEYTVIIGWKNAEIQSIWAPNNTGFAQFILASNGIREI